MQRLPKRFITGTLTTTPADNIYTAPTSTRGTISAASVTNTTSTPRTVTAYVTPSGGTAYVAYLGVIPANQPVVMTTLIAQTLDPGDALTVKADADAAVDVDVSGYQTVP